jgi:phospholipid transport system substrate-binding protein
MKISRFLLFIITLLSQLTLNTEAISAPNVSSAAESFISATSAKTLAIIKSNAIEEQKTKQLTAIFNEVVDIDWMAKFAVAKIWKTMTNVQKRAYLNAYHEYLIKTYVPRFSEYNNQEIKITNVKDIGNDQYIVSIQVISDKNNSDSITINIGYRCKLYDDKFKIRDMIGENFSLLTTQRSEFASVVAKGGIDLLIKTLSAK